MNFPGKMPQSLPRQGYTRTSRGDSECSKWFVKYFERSQLSVENGDSLPMTFCIWLSDWTPVEQVDLVHWAVDQRLRFPHDSNGPGPSEKKHKCSVKIPIVDVQRCVDFAWSFQYIKVETINNHISFLAWRTVFARANLLRHQTAFLIIHHKLMTTRSNNFSYNQMASAHKNILICRILDLLLWWLQRIQTLFQIQGCHVYGRFHCKCPFAFCKRVYKSPTSHSLPHTIPKYISDAWTQAYHLNKCCACFHPCVWYDCVALPTPRHERSYGLPHLSSNAYLRTALHACQNEIPIQSPLRSCLQEAIAWIRVLGSKCWYLFVIWGLQ